MSGKERTVSRAARRRGERYIVLEELRSFFPEESDWDFCWRRPIEKRDGDGEGERERERGRENMQTRTILHACHSTMTQAF